MLLWKDLQKGELASFVCFFCANKKSHWQHSAISVVTQVLRKLASASLTALTDARECELAAANAALERQFFLPILLGGRLKFLGVFNALFHKRFTCSLNAHKAISTHSRCLLYAPEGIFFCLKVLIPISHILDLSHLTKVKRPKALCESLEVSQFES